MKVFLVSEFGETYLGTVHEVVEGRTSLDSGEGEAFSSILADIVSSLAFDYDAGDTAELRIELR